MSGMEEGGTDQALTRRETIISPRSSEISRAITEANIRQVEEGSAEPVANEGTNAQSAPLEEPRSHSPL